MTTAGKRRQSTGQCIQSACGSSGPVRKLDQCAEVAGSNQQEDGHGLLQNIVTNLGKGSRKGLRDGRRECIRVDNDRVLDVGAPRRGMGTLNVRKPKAPEGNSDVIVSQGEPG